MHTFIHNTCKFVAIEGELINYVFVRISHCTRRVAIVSGLAGWLLHHQCELYNEEFLSSSVHAKKNQIDPIRGRVKGWILITCVESE